MISKTCCECGQLFFGRSDKKFCDDYCRNLHNNRLNSNSTSYIRKVNNTLKKNRRILESLFTSQTENIPCQGLTLIGFDFTYCTHINITKDGKTFYYCYEYGYLLCNSECTLIKNEKS